QRRCGAGPWTAVGDSKSRFDEWKPNPYSDTVPDTPGALRYRIRTLVRGVPSRWVYSDPVPLDATLRLVQTKGRKTQDGDSFEVAVEGRLESIPAGQTISFDPATESLRALFGSAAAPSEFTVPPGGPGWLHVGDTFHWAGDALDTAQTIDLDLGRRTFRAT